MCCHCNLLPAVVQLYRNYADLYSSVLCRYHETLEVMKLSPEDAELANAYDETTFATAFPLHKFGGKVDKNAKAAIQVESIDFTWDLPIGQGFPDCEGR